MSLASFLRSWFRRSRQLVSRPDARGFRRRPRLEELEDRCVPATAFANGVGAFATGVGVFAPDGGWFLRSAPSTGAPDVASPFGYGGAKWSAVVGDWNGDGGQTPGVFDPTTATFYLRDSNSSGAPTIAPFRYGGAGWVAVAGDWDGDGDDSVGVFDPTTATWYLKNTNTPGAPDVAPFRYGAPGWVPIVGDWDGDGRDTVGVVDPATMTFYLRDANTSGAPNAGSFAFGAAGWVAVAGDWDGDGRTTIGAFDPGFATWYLKNANTSGTPDIDPFVYGGQGWTPLAVSAPAAGTTRGNHGQLPTTPFQPFVPVSAGTPTTTTPTTITNTTPSDPANTTPTGGPSTGTPSGQAVIPHLPVSFEPNVGQADTQSLYVARGRGYTGYLMPDGLVMAIPKYNDPDPTNPDAPPTYQMQTLAMQLVGASTAAMSVTAENLLPGKVNYFIGDDPSAWHADVPTYAEVAYRNIYAGIDAVYHGQDSALKYDFLIHPGGDPSAIRMHFYGSDTPTVDDAGNLVLRVGDGTVIQSPPVVYQEDGGARTPVEARFFVHAGGDVGFQLGTYDPNRTVVIDPSIVYSTLLGGQRNEQAGGIQVDAAGNAYVVGSSPSTNYPITPGVYQATQNVTGTNQGGHSIVVSKINPQGTALVYSTYVGGTGNSANATGAAIAIDPTGAAYVTGQQNDNTGFPTTSGAWRTTPPAGIGTNALALKLSPAGNQLVYSTYIAATVFIGNGTGIAVDANGQAFVVGRTGGGGAATNLQTTAGAFQERTNAAITGSNGPVGFVVKLAANGSAPLYATYLAGTTSAGAFGTGTRPWGITIDTAGNAYVAGETDSSGFPTANAVTATRQGSVSAFVTKLNPQGSGLVYSTFLGGSNGTGTITTSAKSIALDAAGSAYVGGFTNSTNFPVTGGAFQTSYGGGTNDAFIAKLTPGGNGLAYASYLGTNVIDQGFGVAVDSNNNATLVGQVDRTGGVAFPNVNPIQSPLTALQSKDGFVTTFNPTGTALVFSTNYGGLDDDQVNGVAVDTQGKIHIVGVTESDRGTSTTAGFFPVSTGAIQVQNNGNPTDMFVAMIDATPPVGPPPPPPPPPPPGGPVVPPTGVFNASNGVEDVFEPNDTAELAVPMGPAPAQLTIQTLSLPRHADGPNANLPDQDWFKWTIQQSGTLNTTLNNIQAGGGDIHLRVFRRVGTSDTEIGSSTRIGGGLSQTVSVPVNAGDSIIVWVFGFNFAQGRYDMLTVFA